MSRTDDEPDARTRRLLAYLESDAVPALVAAGIPRDRAWTIAAEGMIDRINRAYADRARRVPARRLEEAPCPETS